MISRGKKKKKKTQQTQLLEALEQTSLASLPTEAMLQEKKWHSTDLIAVPPLITYVA